MAQDTSVFSERDKFLLSDHDVPTFATVKQPKLQTERSYVEFIYNEV